MIPIRDPLLLPEIMIILVIIVFLIIAYINLRGLHRLSEYTKLSIFPRLSVLVPARNEETCIGPCVESLLKQDYPNYEVIVLDDNSTDRTLDILQEFARKDPRLKIIKGKPLPDDWLGKHWACQQLSEEADGELYLFIDADTMHEPDMLRCAAAAMEGEKAALISVLPHQIVVSWPEKLSIPAFYLGMLCGVPIGLTRLQTNPLLFVCLGQFLMFQKDAYWAAGGYSAVKQNIVDDLAIGRRIVAMRLRYRLLDGYRHISCRMYKNLDQVWKGLTKSTFATFNFNPFFMVFIYLLILILFLGPIALLIASPFIPGFPLSVLILTLVATMLAATLWIISDLRFHFPFYLVFTYPLSVVFMTVIALASMVLTLQGKARWKDRGMPKFVKL